MLPIAFIKFALGKCLYAKRSWPFAVIYGPFVVTLV